MFTLYQRMLFTGLSLGLSYYGFARGNTTIGMIMLLSTLLLISGYFLYGTVSAAHGRMRKQDYAGAETILRQTKFPQWLAKSHKGLYHFYQGLLDLNKNQVDSAYEAFQLATQYGVRTQHNLAMAFLNMANIDLYRGNPERAREYLAKVKSLSYKAALLPEIEATEEKIQKAFPS